MQRHLLGCANSVCALACSGRTIVSAEAGKLGLIRLWDAPSGQCQALLHGTCLTLLYCVSPVLVAQKYRAFVSVVMHVLSHGHHCLWRSLIRCLSRFDSWVVPSGSFAGWIPWSKVIETHACVSPHVFNAAPSVHQPSCMRESRQLGGKCSANGPDTEHPGMRPNQSCMALFQKCFISHASLLLPAPACH